MVLIQSGEQNSTISSQDCWGWTPWRIAKWKGTVFKSKLWYCVITFYNRTVHYVCSDVIQSKMKRSTFIRYENKLQHIFNISQPLLYQFAILIFVSRGILRPINTYMCDFNLYIQTYDTKRLQSTKFSFISLSIIFRFSTIFCCT